MGQYLADLLLISCSHKLHHNLCLVGPSSFPSHKVYRKPQTYYSVSVAQPLDLLHQLKDPQTEIHAKHLFAAFGNAHFVDLYHT
jgi:hypothetical protein